MLRFLDSNYVGVHGVGALPENLSINTLKKNFASNLLSQGSIKQDYLSKKIKNLSFWGV